MRTTLLVGMLILICAAIGAHGQNVVANAPQGFQSQFHAVFEAFEQQNESVMQDRLQTFAIPAHWFTDSFVPAQAPEFAHQYAEAFAVFKRRSAANFAGIDALKTRLHVDAGIPVDIRTRRWTPAESSSPPHLPALRAPLLPVQKFEIDCVLDAPGQGARLTSWIESFIYIDGAFRFFGQGGKPFWTTSLQPRTSKSPDNIRKPKPHTYPTAEHPRPAI